MQIYYVEWTDHSHWHHQQPKKLKEHPKYFQIASDFYIQNVIFLHFLTDSRISRF